MTRNIILVITMMAIYFLNTFSQTTTKSTELSIDRIFNSSEFAQEVLVLTNGLAKEHFYYYRNQRKWAN